ncbi:8971_t:CDS:2 [Scutellospora calospora]|uniref:8971_t:CDS:1 n=1 Tax=Scutellospora calospora TaxID=85575 RepID=A0ACA9K670_9GLOM|nr:8971_t:CDS:2 [Scutellospora calospora]
MPTSPEENACDSPYSSVSDDFTMNNIYFSSNEISQDNPSTLLDPKLEVVDSNTPLFFITLTPQQTPTRELQSPVTQNDPQADRQCQAQDISDKGLQIRVLGVPQTGAKSRVETQIKLCLQLVTDKGEKVPLWSHLRLPEYMVAKEKLKTKNARNPQDSAMNISEKGVLNLEATVVCASEMPKKVLTCLGCVQRLYKI